MWEDKGNWESFFDNQSLVNISDIEGAKQDFNGQYNTKVIRSHGRAVGVSNPAAEAAHNYRVNGRRMGWYLPAAGQLHLICENRAAINKVLKGYGSVKGDYIYWSSTEKNSAYAWPVGMYSGVLDGNTYKSHGFKVRAVAPVPVSSSELPSSAM